LCISPSPKPGEKAPAHPLQEAVEAFLLTKRVAGCADTTLRSYAWWLESLLSHIPEVTSLAVRGFFALLQERGLSASRRHQAYRTLKTFFRWCVETGVFVESPLRGFTMRTPKTLPDVPTEDELRSVLTACSESLEGIRNRALLLLLADSGLRANELLHLLIEDWRAADRGLFVRAGKGCKDRVAFIGPTTTRALKSWLSHHPQPTPEAFLFHRPPGLAAQVSAPSTDSAPA
jgi:site-specific recombinase XerD